MTEEDAIAWVQARYPPAAVDRLAKLVGYVCIESARQNLVSAASLPFIWCRHVVDSVQLEALADHGGDLWIDIGTGAGFPGLAIACIRDAPILIVEPRRRRADFLAAVVETLALRHAEVWQGTIEKVQRPAQIVSARAVAPLATVLEMAQHCTSADTRWILPRGRSAPAELQDARGLWKGAFHVEQSITDPSAGIVIATQVRRR